VCSSRDLFKFTSMMSLKIQKNQQKHVRIVNPLWEVWIWGLPKRNKRIYLFQQAAVTLWKLKLVTEFFLNRRKLQACSYVCAFRMTCVIWNTFIFIENKINKHYTILLIKYWFWCLHFNNRCTSGMERVTLGLLSYWFILILLKHGSNLIFLLWFMFNASLFL
jgi:hypothetical protein